LELEVWRFAHTPLQSTVPLGHAQLLLTHTKLLAQIWAQKPQLFLSLVRFTHAFMQLARPCAQFTLQFPFEHTWPPMQRLPQEPQFRGSLAVSEQVIPHCVSPEEHWQTPAEHVAPSGQAFPQLPQSRVSVWVSTHAPLGGHEVCPVGQPAVHAPLTHWLPAPQRLPHEPQLRGSVCVSTHTPLQLVVPAEH